MTWKYDRRHEQQRDALIETALVTSTLAGSPFMSKQEGNALVRGKDIKGTVVVLSKTQPQQLSLFQTFLPADERYSNTIDLSIPSPKPVMR
jgi:hypothetical protein